MLDTGGGVTTLLGRSLGVMLSLDGDIFVVVVVGSTTGISEVGMLNVTVDCEAVV